MYLIIMDYCDESKALVTTPVHTCDSRLSMTLNHLITQVVTLLWCHLTDTEVILTGCTFALSQKSGV